MAGDSGRIQAAGYFIEAFGTYDLKIALDTHQLNPAFWPFDPASGRVSIRGSMVAWAERDLLDDGDPETSGDDVAGDGRYTYLHSVSLGAHDGLLNGEQRAQFVLSIDGREYRLDGLLPAGISAWTNCAGSFEPAPIFMEPDPRSGKRNPTVVVCESAGRLPIGSVVPPEGVASGGTQVSIYGDGFAPDAGVMFGSRPALDLVWVAAGQINCRTPSAEPGPVTVRVNNPDGEFGERVAGFFYTQRMGPEIRHVSPAGGPIAGGTSVTLSGVRFSSGATVAFGGAPATGVQVLSARRLTCLSPAHADGTVSITLANPDGTSTALQQAFEYSDQPDRVVDWAGLQGPAGLMLYPFELSPAVVGRVYEPALTRFAGCHQEIQAQLGWGPPDSNPAVEPDAWTWAAATCNGDCPACGEADEYHGWLEPELPGPLGYAFRFSRDAGESWTLADLGMGSRDGYQPAQAGWLEVLDAGQVPLVRSVSPAAASVLGGSRVLIEGLGFAADSLLLLDGLELPVTVLGPEGIEAELPAHPVGPAALVLVQPEPDYRELYVPGGFVYVLGNSPQIDGAIETGPDTEWPEPFLAARNTEPSDWGPNRLDALWVAFDATHLYLAVTGWVDPAAGNAIVLYLDTDYGVGSGVTDANGLIDELGFEDQPGLDLAISSRWIVTDPAFGAEFAVGTRGMAAVAEDEQDPRVWALAGLRSLADSAHFDWRTGSVQTAWAAPGDGAIELALPWTSLFSGGLPAAGARLAVFARILSRDGEAMANACLPPDDPLAPTRVGSVFVFEAR